MVCLFCEQNGLFLAWYGSFLKGNSTVRFEVMVTYVSNSVIASILYITRQLTRKIEKITLYNGIIRNSQVYLLVWLIFDGAT